MICVILYHKNSADGPYRGHMYFKKDLNFKICSDKLISIRKQFIQLPSGRSVNPGLDLRFFCQTEENNMETKNVNLNYS